MRKALQPLNIIALVIGGLPGAAFLLTLYLSDGAPFKPIPATRLFSGEESGSVAVARIPPQPERERRTGSTAADYAPRGPGNLGVGPGASVTAAEQTASPGVVVYRGTELFQTPLGAPYPHGDAAR